jgi:hypothetical protein
MKILYHLRQLSQARQFARPSRPNPRTGQNPIHRYSVKLNMKTAGFFLTMRGERNVRRAGVPARKRPFGFTMSKKIKLSNHTNLFSIYG